MFIEKATSSFCYWSLYPQTNRAQQLTAILGDVKQGNGRLWLGPPRGEEVRSPPQSQSAVSCRQRCILRPTERVTSVSKQVQLCKLLLCIQPEQTLNHRGNNRSQDKKYVSVGLFYTICRSLGGFT